MFANTMSLRRPTGLAVLAVFIVATLLVLVPRDSRPSFPLRPVPAFLGSGGAGSSAAPERVYNSTLGVGALPFT